MVVATVSSTGATTEVALKRAALLGSCAVVVQGLFFGIVSFLE